MTRPQRSSGIRTAAILIGVIAVLYLAREILIPLAFAITLTLVLAPAVGWLQKLHVGRFPAALTISAIPPFAFSHARNLNRQLRAKFAQTKILIGVWGFNGEIDARFSVSNPRGRTSL